MDKFKNAVGDKIRGLRKSKKLTLVEFAHSLGLKSPSQISGWERNEHQPNFGNLSKIEKVYGINLISNQNQLDIHHSNAGHFEGLDMLDEPVIKINFNKCTIGLVDEQGNFANEYTIPKDFLSFLGISATEPVLKIFSIIGDAMEPDIKGEEKVIIDTSSNNPIKEGAIYLIKVDKVPYVRRLSQQSECLLLIPRNDTYPKREYKLDEVSVIGRVVGKINVSTKKI